MPDRRSAGPARRLYVAAGLAVLTLGLPWINGDPRFTGRMIAPLFVCVGVAALAGAARRVARTGQAGWLAAGGAASLAYPLARYIRILDLRVLVLLAVAVALALSTWKGTRTALDKVTDAIT